MGNCSRKIKVLMFGWEFPPFNSGGLGVACAGLTKALSSQGIKVIFVLPRKLDYQVSFCKMIFADSSLKLKKTNSFFSPYLTFPPQEKIQNSGKETPKSCDLFAEVFRYAREAEKIAKLENFDIIHAHDWLSFPAALRAKKISQKPLIVHIHATEFDRTGDQNPNPKIYEIEREGALKADLIIANSNFTKKKIVSHYGIGPEKIRVVYNAVERSTNLGRNISSLKKGGAKIVLFVGRITIQKGPDYFIRAAKKVLEKNKNVFFVIAGSGDMEPQIIEEAARLKIADKVLFAGFLRGKDLTDAYQMADLFVLPSVSEPFGIAPLEALSNGTPVLISKQSGVSEILSHCLKVDFWNIDEMANKISAVLEYPELHHCLKENGTQELKKVSWQESARKCIGIYKELLKI